MAGIAEAIAIASCVAALISAYKDGGSILSNIKRKRRARGALPPTIHLERSLEKGEKAIVEAVLEGREHFGPGYEFGDDKAIQALKDITIETQKALLSRLAAATEDDSITDFTACIIASDRGRLQALNVLNDLYLRKQAETAQQPQPINITANELNNSSAPWQHEPSRMPLGISPQSAMQSADPIHSTNPKPRSKSIPWPFRRSSRPGNSTSPSIDSTNLAQADSSHHSRSTSAALSSSPPTTRSIHSIPMSPSSQSSVDPFELRGTNTGATPGIGIYPSNTFSTTGTRLSRSSSDQVPSISPTIDRSTLCKYSYHLRAGLKEDALRFYDQSITGQHNYRFKCKSTSCAFQCVARKPAGRNKWMIDERVRTCKDIEFRWLFLAKSHVPRTSTVTEPKFRCLVCVLGGDSSLLFEGHIELFEHIRGHRDGYLGPTLLDGPLTFTNEGAKVDPHTFDINFQRPIETSLSNASSSPPATFPMATAAYSQPEKVRQSHWSDELDNLDDPWADAWQHE